MTGVIYNCPNLGECLQNSPLDRMEAMLLYFLNKGVKPEDIKTEVKFDRLSSISYPSPPSDEITFTCNRDSENRDRIIFGAPVDWPQEFGGLKYFDTLTIGRLQHLIREGFVNPSARHNLSPTIEAFLEFARIQASKGCEFTFLGYAISPSREDYRVSIDGIIFNGHCSFELVSEFNEFAYEADELDIQPHYLRAWWD